MNYIATIKIALDNEDDVEVSPEELVELIKWAVEKKLSDQLGGVIVDVEVNITEDP